MGCWHGHTSWCTPWGCYGHPVDEAAWFAEQDWPVRRPRYRREQPVAPETTVTSLEARLDELRDELQRVEATLGQLRSQAGEAPEQR